MTFTKLPQNLSSVNIFIIQLMLQLNKTAMNQVLFFLFVFQLVVYPSNLKIVTFYLTPKHGMTMDIRSNISDNSDLFDIADND